MNLFPSAVEKKEINDLLMRSNDIPTSALPEKAEINLSDEDDDFLIGERNVDINISLICVLQMECNVLYVDTTLA